VGNALLFATLFSLIMGFFLFLGWLILSRVPGNRIGWLFPAMALSIGASGVLGGLADLGYLTAAAAAGAFWLMWLGLISLFLLWFPTGRPPTPRWRFVEVLIYLGIAIDVLASVFTEYLCLDGDAGDCHQWVRNPLGIAGVPHPEYSDLIGGIVVVGLIAAVVSIVWRYRISGAIERRQLKWFLLAVVIFAISLGAEVIYELVMSSEAPPWVGVVNAAGVLALPIAATIAILRYRLYEIDRLISRTVSYTLVVGLLIGGVAGVAALAGSRFHEPWVVAATTLGVAALFNPLRRRVQDWVDRRFNRSHYDAERVIDGFAGSLRDEVDGDEVVEGWVQAVTDTMQPSAMGVWVRVS
jgi:hypothetical protein